MTVRTDKRKTSLWGLVLGTLITTSLSAGAVGEEKEAAKGKNSNSLFGSLKNFTQKKADTVKEKALAAKETALEKGLSATCGLCASPKIFVLSKSDTALNVALKNCIKNCVQRKYTLRLMSALPEGGKPAENEIYVEKQDNQKLKCKLLNLKGEVVERTIDHSVGGELTQRILDEYAKKAILAQLSKAGDIRIVKGVNTLLDDLMAQKGGQKDQEEAPKESTEKIEESRGNQEEIKRLEEEIAQLEGKIRQVKEGFSTPTSNADVIAARNQMKKNAIEGFEGKIKDLIEQRDKLKKPKQNLESVPNHNLEAVPENDEIERQIDKIKKVAIEVVEDLNREKEKKMTQYRSIEERIRLQREVNKNYNSKDLDKKVSVLKSEVKSLINKINTIQNTLGIPDIWQRGS